VAIDEDWDQVHQFMLKNSLRKKDWSSIDKICRENQNSLSNKNLIYWIRAKFSLRDFSECYRICSENEGIIDPSISREIFRFRLKSAHRLKDLSLLDATISKCSSIFPDYIEHKKHKIFVDYENQDFSACVKICNEILSEEPDNLNALRYRARATTKSNSENAEILSVWKSLLERNSNDLEAMNNIARILISSTNLSEARKLVDTSLNLNPSHLPTITTMAMLIETAREKGEEEIVDSIMVSLRNLSKSNLSASKHYCRQLLYFSSDETFISTEIGRMYSNHGGAILPDIVKFVLKSGKYSIIKKSQIAPDISDLIDPIAGGHTGKMDPVEFQKLWIEMKAKIIHAISSNDTDTKKKSSEPYIETILKIRSDKSLDLEANHGSIAMRLENQCFQLPEEITTAGKLVIFSNSPFTDEYPPGIDRIVRFSLNSQNYKCTMDHYIDRSGQEFYLGSETSSQDPRIILGRFHSLTGEFSYSQHFKLACMVRIISDENPSMIWYDENHLEAIIASKILGYSEINVSSAGH